MQIGVFAGELVTRFTVGLRGVFGREALAPKNVHLLGYGLYVRRVAAGPIPAQMVQLKLFWDWPNEKFIGQPMYHHRVGSHRLDGAVTSSADGSAPNPARRVQRASLLNASAQQEVPGNWDRWSAHLVFGAGFLLFDWCLVRTRPAVLRWRSGLALAGYGFDHNGAGLGSLAGNCDGLVGAFRVGKWLTFDVRRRRSRAHGLHILPRARY